jgi:hypothetical protein
MQSGILHSLFTSTASDDRVRYQLNTDILLPAQEIIPQSETYKHIFTLQRVTEALPRLDIPICPHVRLNQSLILAGYNPRCRFTLKDMACPCSHTTRPEVSSRSCQRHPNPCPHTICCTSCRNDDLSTFFVLHVIEDTRSIKGPKQAALALLISRDLDNLENASHTAWLSNSFSSS